MTKHLLVLGTCAGMLFSSPAFATQSRVNSMGGGVKQITVDDEVNIFDFPSLLVRYGNRVYLDNLQVNSEFQNGRFGFHYNLNDDTVIALFGANINSNTRAATTFDPSAVGSASDTSFFPTGNVITGSSSLGVGYEASQAPEAQGGSLGAVGSVEYRYGLMFATLLGTSTRFGLMLNVLVDNDDIKQPTGAQLDQGGMLFDLAVGLGLDLEGSELELSAGLVFGFADHYQDTASAITGQPTELLQLHSVSHTGFRLEGRWIFDFLAQSKIVAYTKFLYGSQSVEFLNVPPGTFTPQGHYSGMNWTLGADLRLEPFEDVIVTPGLGLRLAQQTLEGTTAVNRDADMALTLPFYGVGVDLKVTDWIDVRFGAAQYVNILRDSDTNASAGAGLTSEVDTSDVVTTFAMGLGFDIPVSESTLTLDLDINPDFLINGPDFVTGTATGQFALNAAMKYVW